jgi:hypothetical protein
MCGLEKVCHDRSAPAPYQCTLDGGFCSPGWRCGLEGLCHDEAIPSDYLCADDGRCEGGWRCGFAGRCVNPAGETGPVAPSANATPVVWGPVFQTHGADAVAVLHGSYGDDVAVQVGDSVRYFRSAPGSEIGVDVWQPDAGAASGATGLEVDDKFVYLLKDAGVEVLSPFYGPSFVPLTGAGPASLTQAPAYGPLLREGASLTSLTSYSMGFTPPVVTPQAMIIPSCALFADNLGVYACGLGSSPPCPASNALSLDGLVNEACIKQSLRNGSYHSIDLRYSAERPYLVAISSAFVSSFGATRPPPGDAGFDAYPKALSLYDISRLKAAQCVPPDGGSFCTAPPVTKLVGPCDDPCTSGDVLTEFRPTPLGIEVECTGPYSQSTVLVGQDALGCTQTLLTGTSSRFRDRRLPRGTGNMTHPSPGSVAQYGAHGQVWVGDAFSTAVPLFLDEAPLGLARARPDDGGVGEVVAVAPTSIGWFRADAGILARQGPESVATVEGGDDQLISASRRIVRLDVEPGGVPSASPRRVAELDVLPADFRAPVHALYTSGPAGGRGLWVSVFDSLYVGVEGQPSVPVPLMVVPQPGVAILAIAALPASDGGVATEGYAATRTSVLHLAATSASSWSASAVSMPPGRVIKVWLDGASARAGYDDGRVVSLPSRIPVAPETPSAKASDFVSACGQTWALTPKQVLRLSAPDGGIGRWVPEPLPGGDAVTSDGLEAGRLFFRDGQVWVFNRFGGGLSFPPGVSCP